ERDRHGSSSGVSPLLTRRNRERQRATKAASLISPQRRRVHRDRSNCFSTRWRYVNSGELFTQDWKFSLLRVWRNYFSKPKKTRMTLNPIPGTTLQKIIVDALPMPAALKESSSRSSCRRVSGRTGRYSEIGRILHHR